MEPQGEESPESAPARVSTTPPRPSVAPPGTPAVKPYEPGWLLRWVYRRFFSHLQVDEAWSGAVRDSARRGVVVYVMRSLSFLDFLCLDFLLKRFGLPLVRFVNDLGLWILEPFGRGERRLRLKRQIPEEKALGDVVTEGFSALLFLRRPPRLGRTSRKGEALEKDLIRTLVETQRRLDKPILLVPQTFVWSKLPPKHRRGIVDLFFGPVEWPGRVRVFFQFLFNHRNALLRSGEPFDLRAFLDEHQELTDAEAADKVRYALLRRIERERTLVLGPTKKTQTRIQDELLRSPRVREHIEKEARTRKVSIAKVEAEARKDLRKLCANQMPYMVTFLSRVLGWVFHRIYDGVVVDRDGIERVREAAREGTVVYLPSHKSHVDYLVLSMVLFRHALSAPLIAAGDNLSFWPLGPILRRGGAFFIRRSFKGKKLYPVLVDAYMRRLIVEGFPLEFFVEGGRSRTGKLLAPKFGLLTMVVDAALKLRMKKVFFVPVSIGYERIIEERSYVHELGGGEKQKENVGGLLKTSEVLRSKYGRLYVQFGKVLAFDDVLKWTLGEERAESRDEITPSQRRALVQRVGHRVTYQIDRVTVVTPAALVASALLVHQRRGIARSALIERAVMLLEALRRQGARVADALVAEDGVTLREDTLDQALGLFYDAKLVREAEATGGEAIYRVSDQRRLALEYYKNNLLHFFVPSALISAALLRGEGTLSLAELRERVRWLSRLFKYEFMYRADAPFERIFDEAVATMIEAGEIEREGGSAADGPVGSAGSAADGTFRSAGAAADGTFRSAGSAADGPGDDAATMRVGRGEPGRHLEVYAVMLGSYLEAYHLAARAAESLDETGTDRKSWLKKTLSLGQRMYLAGEIEHREAISKDKLEGALSSLKDLQVVKLGPENAVARGAEPASTVLEPLARYLR